MKKNATRPTALLAIALLLSGCSASADQPTDPTSAPTVSATEYIPASADGPAQNVPIPESYNETQEFSEEGLRQGAQAWLDAVHHLAITGDGSLVMALSMEDCPVCLETNEAFEEIYEKGGWIDSAGVYEFDIYLTDFVEDDPTNYLAADLIALPETEYSQDGTVVEENTAPQTESISVDIAMIFDETEHRWKMLGMVINDLDDFD